MKHLIMPILMTIVAAILLFGEHRVRAQSMSFPPGSDPWWHTEAGVAMLDNLTDTVCSFGLATKPEACPVLPTVGGLPGRCRVGNYDYPCGFGQIEIHVVVAGDYDPKAKAWQMRHYVCHTTEDTDYGHAFSDCVRE